MAYSHRINDLRVCGAVTQEQGQDFVKIEGQLWAVHGDPNSDGAGGLKTSNSWLKINGKGIIVAGDSANEDNKCQPLGFPHCDPKASGFSDLVKVTS